MKKLLQIAFLAAGLVGLALHASAAEQKIGFFNLRKAFDHYYVTIQSQGAIDQEKAEIRKELEQMVVNGKKHKEEWRQLIDHANDQSLSADERDKAKKAAEQKYAELENDDQAITATERSADARLREKERQKRDDIVSAIIGVVTAHAKTAGYTLVLDNSGESANGAPTVLYTNGQDDLTDVIIKELNASAPPGSLDAATNSTTHTATNTTNLPSLTAPSGLFPTGK